jgi:hypothetical protein
MRFASPKAARPQRASQFTIFHTIAAFIGLVLLMYVGYSLRGWSRAPLDLVPPPFASPTQLSSAPNAGHADAHATTPGGDVAQAKGDVAETKAAGTSGTAEVVQKIAAMSQCSKMEWGRGALVVGNQPVGTYLCEYFPGATRAKGGCVLTCPAARARNMFSDADADIHCTVLAKGTSEQLRTADIVVNHHGPVPKRHRPDQITVFYSGESNFSEGKKAAPSYQAQYAEVVSFHRWRRFHFTWTNRFATDFSKIAAGNGNFPQPKHDAIVVFVSRCGKGGRDGVIRRLMKAYDVHSFGGCVRTHRVSQLHPECVDESNRYREKLCVFSKYRFALTLDNTREEDYVTEKIYHALISGPIPIYDGAPNINDFLPTPDSIIRMADFVTTASSEDDPKQRDFRHNPAVLDVDRLVRKLKEITTADHTAAELAWRKHPETWSAEFWRNANHLEPTCDLCVAAIARRCEHKSGGAARDDAAG